MGLSPAAVTESSDEEPVSRNKFLDVQLFIKCGFTLERVLYMIRTCNKMDRRDNYSQSSPTIWAVRLNG